MLYIFVYFVFVQNFIFTFFSLFVLRNIPVDKKDSKTRKKIR